MTIKHFVIAVSLFAVPAVLFGQERGGLDPAHTGATAGEVVGPHTQATTPAADTARSPRSRPRRSRI